MHDHDHSTHSAKCDQCDYIAQTHAHDDDGAVEALSTDLANHNLEVHKMKTMPGDIKEAVRAKMKVSE